MPMACSLMGVTRTPDGAGGYTEVPTLKQTTHCGLSGGVMVGEISAEVAAKLQGRNVYRFRLPSDSPAAIGDGLVVGARTFSLLSLACAPDATVQRGLCAEV